MSFKSIAGQSSAIEFLRRSIARDRLSHSYIFTGPKGTGRFTTAIELAKAINCAAKSGDACDECPTCKKINSRNHIDLIIVSGSPSASGEVKIDMVRSLQYLINLKPYEMRKKVCIIDGADNMNQTSSNALLKTLEEPPSDSILILIVENPANVLPTIQSRCQQVRFGNLPVLVLEEILKREHSLGGAEARSVAQLASGRIGEALKIIRQGALQGKNRIIDALASGALFDEDRFAISREWANEALDIILSWYRDIVMAKLGIGEGLFMNIDRLDAIRKAADRGDLEIEDLARLTEEIIDSRFYLERNVNFKLVWSLLGQKIRGASCTR